MVELAPYSDFGEFIFKLFNKVFEGKTQTDIAKTLGTYQSVISKWYKGERLPTPDFVKKIKDITGVDISDDVANANISRKKKRGTILITSTHKKPLIDENKLMDSIRQSSFRPRIELSAIAGKPAEYTDDTFDLQPIIPLLPNYDFTIKVNGDSMMPEYQSGDEVACLKVEKGEFTQWGRVFVINSSQGAFIKRLYRGTYGYRCVSDNPKYPEFEIPEEEVYSISLVVGLLRIY